MALLRAICHRHSLPVFKSSVRNCISVSWKSKKEPLKIEKIGGKYIMSMIPGMGDTSTLAMKCLSDLLLCCGAPLIWETIRGDFAEEEEFKELLYSVKRNGIAIKGSIDPFDASQLNKVPRVHMNRNMTLRRTLDLHAFIIEIKSFEGLKPLMKLHKDVDVILVRQNTEGAYTLLEHSPKDKVVESFTVITKENSRRLAECAFRYAIRKKRKVVQCLHRADVLPLAETMFVEGFLEVAATYPEVEHKVIKFPEAFDGFIKDTKYLDVAVLSGLEGVILTNYILGMIGGANLIAGMNVGDTAVVMEPAARQKDAEDNTNPTAYFLCGASLLDMLGKTDIAEVIRSSIEEVFLGKVLPRDLGGKATMEEFTEAVIQRVRKQLPSISCSLDKKPELNPDYVNPFGQEDLPKNR